MQLKRKRKTYDCHNDTANELTLANSWSIDLATQQEAEIKQTNKHTNKQTNKQQRELDSNKEQKKNRMTMIWFRLRLAWFAVQFQRPTISCKRWKTSPG